MNSKILLFETNTDRGLKSGEKVQWSKQYYIPSKIAFALILFLTAMTYTIAIVLALTR